MSRQMFTYRDAVAILDGSESPAFRRIERMLGVAAAGVTIATVGAVDFFALRDEFVSWGKAIASGMRERLTGASRLDRTQRIVAAHAVIVITSLFDALDDATNFDILRDAALTREEQASIATKKSAAMSYADVVRSLVESPLPIPAPHRSFEDVTVDVAELYMAHIATILLILGELTTIDRPDLLATMLRQRSEIAEDGVRRYVAAYRALAVDIPEFAVWAGMVDAQATRGTITAWGETLTSALTDLSGTARNIEGLLRGMSPAVATETVRADLVRRYQGQLERPILASAGQTTDAVIPTLRAGYVRHRGRISVAGRFDLPATDLWWREKPTIADVPRLLLGYLATLQAIDGPLVVLGQPGSGKSVLTRILAADLPASDFLVVRVELRNIPADATVQGQIENAIFHTLGERISWPDLVRNAGGALPVVIFDGFDELLQATGVNRADYLEQIQEFQRREADLDRPGAAIVTSRVVVADRARFPDGTVIVRLDPFDDDQVRGWLGIWNGANEVGLARRDLRPLPAEVVLAHPELCRQPLLLMLLAIYDATANELQRASGTLRQVELYERLFTNFVEREVDKDRSLMPEQRRDAIDAEWQRLCAVAVATLNRGGDTITQAELDADIPLLLDPEPATGPATSTIGRPLTVGELLVGRFFFIHESRASRDTGTPERTFEFLHATFGDFLAARQIVDALIELAHDREHQRQLRRSRLDAGYLYAVTSFVTITRRDPLRDFCRGLLAKLSNPERRGCLDLIVDLFPEAGYPQSTWHYLEYAPRRRTSAARYSTFSANLMSLAVFLHDGRLDVGELVGNPVAENWRQMAALWQSQLEPEDRDRLWQNFRIAWEPGDDTPVLTARVEDNSPTSVYASLPWPTDAPLLDSSAVTMGLARDVTISCDSATGRMLRRSAFMQTGYDSREFLYALMPYWDTYGDLERYALGVEPSVDSGRVSNIYILMRLLLEDDRTLPPAGRMDLYRLLLGPEMGRLQQLALQQLASDMPRLTKHKREIEDLLTAMIPVLWPHGPKMNETSRLWIAAVGAVNRDLGSALATNLALGLLNFTRNIEVLEIDHLIAAFHEARIDPPVLHADWLSDSTDLS